MLSFHRRPKKSRQAKLRQSARALPKKMGMLQPLDGTFKDRVIKWAGAERVIGGEDRIGTQGSGHPDIGGYRAGGAIWSMPYPRWLTHSSRHF